MIKYSYISLFLVSIAFMFFVTCKDEDKSVASLEVYLTDSPTAMQEVNLEILSLSLKMQKDKNEKELKLNKSGSINILNYTNGHDTLLSKIELSADTVEYIKLVLGSNNTIVVDNQTFELKIPIDQSNEYTIYFKQGLKLDNHYKLWLDFDAGRSITKSAANKYILNAKIRIFNDEGFGSIKGLIKQAEAIPFVWAYSSTDTIGTVAFPNGTFLLKGVPPGDYKMEIKPQNDMLTLYIDSVHVDSAKVADAGTIVIN